MRRVRSERAGPVISSRVRGLLGIVTRRCQSARSASAGLAVSARRGRKIGRDPAHQRGARRRRRPASAGSRACTSYSTDCRTAGRRERPRSGRRRRPTPAANMPWPMTSRNRPARSAPIAGANRQLAPPRGRRRRGDAVDADGSRSAGRPARRGPAVALSARGADGRLGDQVVERAHVLERPLRDRRRAPRPAGCRSPRADRRRRERRS